MSRPSASPALAPVLLAAALAAIAAACFTPAHAGFGDLVKKAKEKAAQAAVGKTSGAKGAAATDAGAPPEFDDVVLELTEPRLGAVLKGLEAGNRVLAGRAPLVQKRDALHDEAAALMNQHGKAMDAARTKHDDAERCWRDALEEKKSARHDQMQQQMMNDPVLRERMMALAMEMAEAQAAGDTAAVMRLQREAEALSGPTREDSLAAKAKCGAVPPLHPMDLKVRALQRDAAAVEEKLRANDEQSVEAQVKASALEPGQFAMARERLIMWLEAVRAKRAPRGFSEGELAALDAKRAELETALAAWVH